MIKKLRQLFFAYQEYVYQAILAILLIMFAIFDQHHERINYLGRLCFFLNYYLATLLINYYFIPRYLYQKEKVKFAIYTGLLLTWVIVLEELVLEQIFYPNTRGTAFPGVFFTLAEVLPAMLIMVGFKLSWDAFKKEKEFSILQSKVAESELQFLKSQINPHFLFNNLNNLYAYAIEQSPKTPMLILKLSALLRYMLYDCKEKYVPLFKEIEHLHDFVALNELQLENKGEITFESSTISDHLYIAPLILVVFVENAFKHSTSSQVNNIVIDIQLTTNANELHFTCNNNYQLTHNTDQLAKGIGLQNVKARLDLLYPNKHQLSITQDQQQYQVDLKIDLS